MGIGVGTVLTAIGAILRFAFTDTVSGIDMRVVGVILMVAGALRLLIDLNVFTPRRRRLSRADAPLVTDRVAAPEVVDRDV
jgi:hypothetical protein